MFLDCGRKPEYLVRTYKHAERPQARIPDLLAARQQCYQWHHHADLRSYTWPGSVSTCDTFLERGIVRASAGNNLMLTLYR
ncbi:hypothetical protein ATANTOWER_003763 [Ataeniobius toweri]|uniref:Uncharacterized protein n=1 Tax=Ataeniobius toweri TaxID=208326 RepID=A0ABU7A9N3_9TELE|nr:hypothetical protein [Ataeniobius toweri]